MPLLADFEDEFGGDRLAPVFPGFTINALDQGVIGDGTTDDRGALHTLFNTTLATKGGEIYFAGSGTGATRDYLIGSALAIPANVTLTFAPGARLKVATGVTVTIAAQITATVRQIFNCVGTGAVSFASNIAITEYFPQWWGTLGSADDTPLLTAAILAIPDNATMRFTPNLIMNLGSTLTITGRAGLKLLGYGMPLDYQTSTGFIWSGAAGGTMLFLDRCGHCTVRGLFFRAKGAVNNANVAIDIDGTAPPRISTDNIIEECGIYSLVANDSFVGIRISHTASTNNELIKLRHNIIQASSGGCISLENGAINSGSNIFTASNFSAGSVGQRIRIAGAGVAGAPLDTTIIGFTSANVVTLATTAGTTVAANAYWIMGEAWGTAVEIGASANVHQIVIEDNTLSYAKYGVRVLNGFFEAINNNLTDNEYDYHAVLTVSACYIRGSNSEGARQGIYWNGTWGLFVVGCRMANFRTAPGSSYFVFGSGAGCVTIDGNAIEQLPPPTTTVFDLSAAVNINFIARQNAYQSTVTVAKHGAAASSLSYRPVTIEQERGAASTRGTLKKNQFIAYGWNSFNDQDVTPDVELGRNWYVTNTGATVITNFLNGADGQEIVLKFNNTNTTINNGGNFVLTSSYVSTAGGVLVLVKHGAVWTEVSRRA